MFYAAFAYVGGWLSDHAPQRKIVLAGGFALAIAMAALMISGRSDRMILAAVFALAGTFVGVNEALEDSIAAELVSPEQHGMAFGTMAAVNAVGDFGSSLLIGLLWSAYSPTAGFAVAGVLFLAGLVLLLRPRIRVNSQRKSPHEAYCAFPRIVLALANKKRITGDPCASIALCSPRRTAG